MAPREPSTSNPPTGTAAPAVPVRAVVPVSAVLGVLAAVVLVALLGTWAASSGSGPVLRPEGAPPPAGSSASPPPEVAEEETVPRAEDDEREEVRGSDEVPFWLQVLGLVVQVASVLFLVHLLLRAVRAGRRRRAEQRQADDGPQAEFAVLEEPAPARAQRALDADAQAQRAALEEGSARNGIVECWHRFELQAATARIAREPWETSSEFTLRLLDLVEADRAAVAELAALYREARFSDHPLDEDARERARVALAAVHAWRTV